MTKRNYITAEEKALWDRKPMKDHLMLLLCANARGGMKTKPLLVYHSVNSQTFKKYKVQKIRLNLTWRFNKKAWKTCYLSTDWINEVFGPFVKQYLLEINLSFGALLLCTKFLHVFQGHKTSLKNFIHQYPTLSSQHYSFTITHEQASHFTF